MAERRPIVAGVGMQLSVVSTMYRSTPFLTEFCGRAVAAAERVATDFEVVLVNDGCPDGSLGAALELAQRDDRIVVVDLSRNFGHHAAMLTGLAKAKGDRIFLIDCDLEEEPEVLVEFYSRMEADDDLDVVYGVQDQRRDRLVRRAAAWLFYTVFNFLSENPLPRNLLTVRLMTRRFVDALLLFEERETQIAGLWELAGFRQLQVPLIKRDKGSSTYTLSRRMANLVNAITSFSARPLIMMFYVGVFMMMVALSVAAFFTYRKIVHGIDTEGFTALIVAMSFFGGITLAAQGVLGIYLGKIFIETKKRPRAVVRAIHRSRP